MSNQASSETKHSKTENDSTVDSVPLPGILKWKSDLIIENNVRFDPSACGPGLFISDNNTNLRQNVPSNTCHTCRIMDTGWTEGIHYWSIRIIDRGQTSKLLIGIVSSAFDTSLPQHPGQTSDSYGLYLTNGTVYNKGVATAFSSNLLQNNDVLGLLLDLEAQTLTYSKNGQILGTAFGQIPLQGTNIKYYPAVGCLELGQRVSLIRTNQ